MDQFSYACGVMDAFNEVVKAGVKKLALSHPFIWDEDSDKLVIEAEKISSKYGNHMMVEKELLITDLFPFSSNKGKVVILFYRDPYVLDQYLDLIKRKDELLAQQEYKGEKRKQIAIEFGHLLSYSDEAIVRYIESNNEKEE